MRHITVTDLFLSRLYLVLISGLLLILSFPTYSAGKYLIWIALTPFLWVLYQEQSLKRAAFFSLLLGWVFYGGTFSWILSLHPLDWMGLSVPGSALILITGWLVLSLYHSLFWVLFGVALYSVRHAPLKRFLLPPLIWPLLEGARQWGPLGFPWSNLAISQHDNLILLQSLSLFGMEGLDFVILLVNVSAALALLALFGRLRNEARLYSIAEPFRSFLQVGMALIVVAILALYGYAALKEIPPQGESVRIALLQGNIPQNIKWSSAIREHTFAIYRSLIQKAVANKSEIILMPETALPFFIAREPSYLNRLRALVEGSSATLVIGAPDWFVARDGRRYFTNSAMVIAPGNPVPSQYDKQKLVIFGEYVPFRSIIPSFIEKLDILGSDYTVTHRTSPLVTPYGRLGTAICFDSIFPEVLRRQTQEGAQLLAIMTNDAWYKTSTGPFQHFAMARLRAVEERRYLIRAANTGISGIIDPYGRVLAQSQLLTEDVILGKVQMLKTKSFYNRFGFLFPWTLLLGTILLLLPRKEPPAAYS